MVVTPADEGGVEHQPGSDAEPVVAPPRSQEGPVGAVVKDDERPHQEDGRRDGEGENDAGRIHRAGSTSRRTARCTARRTSPGTAAPGRGRAERRERAARATTARRLSRPGPQRDPRRARPSAGRAAVAAAPRPEGEPGFMRLCRRRVCRVASALAWKRARGPLGSSSATPPSSRRRPSRPASRLISWRSSAPTRVMPTPRRPARPVRPMRWMYASWLSGGWKLITCEIPSMSIPRAATSVATSVSTCPD